MNKINKAKITYSVICSSIILAVLVLGITVMPAKTNAQNSPYSTYGSPRSNGYIPLRNTSSNFNFTPAPIYYNPAPIFVNPAPIFVNPAPIVQAPAPTPIVYSNSVNENQAASTPNIVYTTPARNTNNTVTSNGALAQDYSTSLAASAIESNSFMPTSLIGWIFLTILVLLIIIIVRRISGTAANSTH